MLSTALAFADQFRGRVLRRALRLAAAMTTAGLLAACSSALSITDSFTSSAPTPPPRDASIAFDLIDGPPPAVVQKLVADLTAQAEQRNIKVISKDALPTYRVRGYLALQIAGKKRQVAWVWDVYDIRAQRVLRAIGEQTIEHSAAAAKPGQPDGWTSVEEAALGRMAHDCIERLAAFLQAPAQPSATVSPDASPPVAGAQNPGVSPPPAPQPGPGVRADAANFDSIAYVPQR